MVAGDGQRRIVKCIRLDEGSVEIDAEHRQRRDVECSSRVRQKCPFLRLNHNR